MRLSLSLSSALLPLVPRQPTSAMVVADVLAIRACFVAVFNKRTWWSELRARFSSKLRPADTGHSAHRTQHTGHGHRTPHRHRCCGWCVVRETGTGFELVVIPVYEASSLISNN